jgi:hypothetical protein
MKGELITDFSKVKMGEVLERSDGNIVIFIRVGRDGERHFIRVDTSNYYCVSTGLKYYHHIEDKPTILDYIGKWYYDKKHQTIGIFKIINKELDTYHSRYAYDQLHILGSHIDVGDLFIKDTLEEIKQVYREHNE